MNKCKKLLSNAKKCPSAFFFPARWLINDIFRLPNPQGANAVGLLGILQAEPADETWWKLPTPEQRAFFLLYKR